VKKDGRSIIDWMIEEFDSKYMEDWSKESFSLYETPICKHICERYPRADLDTIFFWKVYAQGWLARKSEAVFGTLTELAGNGGEMIEKLAEIPDSDVSSLKPGWEKNLLPEEVQAAFQKGRGGWRVLGYAVEAAKKLVSRYGNGEPSYISLWLREFLCDRRDDEKDLVDAINLQVEKEVIGKSGIDPYTLAINSRYFVEQRLLNPKAHLPGVGSETLSFFFRDWMDVALWKYMWKHDYQNKDFWRLVSDILGSIIGLKGSGMDTVLSFLSKHLTPEEIKDGAIVKINTTAYRSLSTTSRKRTDKEGAIKHLKDELEELMLDITRGEC